MRRARAPAARSSVAARAPDHRRRPAPPAAALRRCRPARGRARRSPSVAQPMSCSQSRRGRAGAAGPAAQRVEPANERGQGQHPPAGAPLAALRQQPGAGGGGRHAQRHPQVQCPHVVATSASARAMEELAGWRPRPAARWPRRPARPRVRSRPARRLAARRPRPATAAAARPGRDGGGAGAAHVHPHARKARGRGQGDHALLLQHGVRLGVVRPVRAYGVQRQAAQAGGDPEAHGGRVFSKAPGSRPTQRRIAGRPPALEDMDGQSARRGRQRQPQGAGGVGGGGGRTQGDEQQVAGLGRQMQPAQRFGTDLGQPAEQAPQLPFLRICSAAQSASAGFSGQTQSNCRGSSRQLIQVTILGAAAAPARSDAVSPAGTGPGAAGGSRPRRDAETAARPGCPSANRHPAARPTAPHVRSAGSARAARQLGGATRRDGCVRGLHGGWLRGAAGCCLLLYKYTAYGAGQT